MPAPIPRVGPSGIVPYDDVDAAAVVTIGQLAEVIERLERLHRATAGAQPIEDWVVLLTDVVNTMLRTPTSETWQTVQVMETLAEIGRHAHVREADSNQVPLSLDDIRSLLAGVLAERARATQPALGCCHGDDDGARAQPALPGGLRARPRRGHPAFRRRRR